MTKRLDVSRPRRPRRTRRKFKVKEEDFCRIWQEANNVREVCERTKMPADSAMARASMYRKKGIGLKKFPQGRPRLVPREIAEPAADKLAALLSLLCAKSSLSIEQERHERLRQIISSLV